MIKNKNSVIIDNKERKTLIRKISEGFVTFFLWIVWGYFILPILTILVWVIGIDLFYSDVISRQGYLYFIETLKTGGITILIVIFLTLSWVYYNFYLFGKIGKRRKYSGKANDEEMAAFFKIKPENLKKIKNQSLIKVNISSDSRINIID